MLYILYGADQFRLREELNRIRSSLDKDGNLAHNTVRLEARGLSVNELQAACQSASFFAEDRLVIIEGLQARFSGTRRGRRPAAASTAPTSDLDAFAAVLTNLPPSTTVILVDETSGVVAEALKSSAKVMPFTTMKIAELRQWAQARIKERGADFHPMALSRLLELIDGAHTGELANEIDKLSTYALGRQVTAADVDTMVSAAKETMAWDLYDPLIEGRGDRALEAYQRMTVDEYLPIVVMTIIRNQYRRLLQAKALQLEGANAAVVADKLGMRPGFAVDKLMTNAARFPADRLDASYRALLQADVNVKTGVMDVETVVPALIVELAELSRPQRSAAAASRR
ncbi:MAG: DNA polymerase III subunit delta [Dehalococcoidia bacterium]